MRVRIPLVFVLVAGTAAADTLGGFSGVDKPYLVNQDRVCMPLPVVDGKASGMPVCEKKAADDIATLRMKPGTEQKGTKASFQATVSEKTITITRTDGSEAVTWNAPDPVAKVVGLWASQYEDRVAIAYTVRRLGREVTDVVAFELLKPTGTGTGTGSGSGTGSGTGTGSGSGSGTAAEDPAVAKAVEAAHRAAKSKQVEAWKKVLALDAQNSEALFRLAVIDAGAKRDPIPTLQELAKSSRADAIEWQIEARFDPAFAPVRADPKYRAAVGLDRKPSSPYERVMGFGGQWEQAGTSCEKAQVDLVFQRDRSFKVRVQTACEGSKFDVSKKGTWRVEGAKVILTIPTKGKAVTSKDEAPCELVAAGDEDSLKCSLGRDLDFVALPTRR